MAHPDHRSCGNRNAAWLAGNGHRRLYHPAALVAGRAGFAPLSAHGAGWHYGGTLMRHFLTGWAVFFAFC